MFLDALGNIFVILFFGALIGIFLTRYYYEKTKNYKLGKTIEGVLISESIKDIVVLGEELTRILNELDFLGGELIENVKKSRDIESYALSSELLGKDTSYNEENKNQTIDQI